MMNVGSAGLRKSRTYRCCLFCIHMPAIDRSFSDCRYIYQPLAAEVRHALQPCRSSIYGAVADRLLVASHRPVSWSGRRV